MRVKIVVNDDEKGEGEERLIMGHINCIHCLNVRNSRQIEGNEWGN